ncbi:MAG: sulfatase [Aureliella sp.]
MSTARAQTVGQQPNLVFVIADDMTFRDIGCYGGQAHTPNIDRLACEGMQFSKCFQAAPMCSPTRHNIYTGLYPVKSGAYPNHTFAKPGTKSIVHFLKPLGYRVALSGKTHIGPDSVFPFEYLGKKSKNPNMQLVDEFIAECKQTSTPLCLFACSNEPHTPWDKGDASRYPPEKIRLPSYIADTPVIREDFSRYLAEITYFDSQVGEILALLEKHGQADNTLVVVVSEQGNSMPFAKWTCYGNGLQSAMIVRWPGVVQAGSHSDALVEYVDITPTFVEAAGGSPPKVLEGKSLLPVLRGEADEHKDYVYGIMTTRGINDGSDMFGIRTVRDKRYRLIWNLNHEITFQNACTTSEGFRSIVRAAQAGDKHAQEVVDGYSHRPEYELFDCEVDPLERNNLFGQPGYEDITQRLQGELEDWMQSQGDQGAETERVSLLRQGRWRNMTLEEAEKAWQLRRNKK